MHLCFIEVFNIFSSIDFPQIVLCLDQNKIMVFMPHHFKVYTLLYWKAYNFASSSGPLEAMSYLTLIFLQLLLVSLTIRFTCKILLKIFRCKNLFNFIGYATCIHTRS